MVLNVFLAEITKETPIALSQSAPSKLLDATQAIGAGRHERADRGAHHPSQRQPEPPAVHQGRPTWVHQAEVDGGKRTGLTSEERARLKLIEREDRELRRANETLKSAAALFGAEPICRIDPEIAPTSYYAARSRPPSARSVRDEALTLDIRRIYHGNHAVYGAVPAATSRRPRSRTPIMASLLATTEAA